MNERLQSPGTPFSVFFLFRFNHRCPVLVLNLTNLDRLFFVIIVYHLIVFLVSDVIPNRSLYLARYPLAQLVVRAI